jgi:hypothetical protein
MSFYEELKQIDLITPIVGKFPIEVGDNGEPIVAIRNRFDNNSPWINHRPNNDRACQLWHYAYFENYRFIPKGCRSCWKVVLELGTLRELMNVMQDQTAEEEFSCKCGIEKRAATGGLGLYLGFWYGRINEGLTGGRRLYKKIKETYPKNEVFLKRGCTEFAWQYPETDRWDQVAQEELWDELEQKLNKIFVIEDVDVRKTPDELRPGIICDWVDWAYEHHKVTGDMTYLDFTGGPAFPPVLTYHDSDHNDKDFGGSKFEPIRIRSLPHDRIEEDPEPDSGVQRFDASGKSEEEGKSNITLL